MWTRLAETVNIPDSLPPARPRDAIVLREVTLELPLCPSVNSYWDHVTRRSKSGKQWTGKRLSAAGIAFRLITNAVVSKAGARWNTKNPVDITIDWWPANNHRQDWDNRIKPLCDALSACPGSGTAPMGAAVYQDDCQIVGSPGVWRHEPIPGGGMRVTVRELDI